MTETASVDLLTRLLEWTESIELSVALWLAGSAAAALCLYVVSNLVVGRLVARKVAGYRTLRRARGPLRLLALLSGLAVALPAADFTPAIADLARHLLRVGWIVLGGWIALVAITATTRYLGREHRLDVADNLEARRFHTQIGILRRAAEVVVVLATSALVLMTFPAVRHIGVSLFASAGAAGLVLGFAARPILANLIAGIQIALTQPIRLDDVVIVEGEWGWIEEITTAYVVVRIWDQRRLIVPLSHFIEKPFQNWTRRSSAITGSVAWHLDYRAPIGAMRDQLARIVEGNPNWDGKVANIQVVETAPSTITVRALVSAASSSAAWDLRCEVRERMLDWLGTEHPEALPRLRAMVDPAKGASPPIPTRADAA